MNLYESLDLDKVKEKIASYASISEAKTFIMEEEVPFNPLIIRNNLAYTKEALHVLDQGHIFSFDGIINCNDLFEKADKNILLTGPELNRLLSFHHHCERIKKQFTFFSQDLLLRDFSDSIMLDKKVFERIEDTIDNMGEVREDASEELKRLSNELRSLEKDLLSRAQRFIATHGPSLQEPVYYIRNGRITFLIRNSDKNRFGGYTYGTSASGLATYVEPGTFVEIDNKKGELEEKREDEIARILMELTYHVSTVSHEYTNNFESLLLLNVIFAKATYGLNNHGIVAELSENELRLAEVAHPLIDRSKVVSNTYTLSDKYQGIVISGSNTGGKTVGLKVIGLSIVSSYLGIPLIASEAYLPLYDHVYVDIDDNQSISDSLSTFSAHITNINDILTHASSHSFILIDELISGTDPKEAQAISLAIIDRIKEIGARFVITTHFDDIKNYAYKDESIMLSAVSFDMEELRPTYHYIENSVGSSNALEIASRYFDDPRIIAKASEYLNAGKTEEDGLMKKLEKNIADYEKLNEKLKKQEEENRRLKEEYDTRLRSFEAEKGLMKEKYRKELEDYLNLIKEEAKEKLEAISSKEDVKKVEEIEQIFTEEEIPQEKEETFAVGDNVRINDNEQIGVLEEIKGDRAVVNIRGMKVRTKLSTLKKMPKTKKSKNTYHVKAKRASAPREINLVGKRVEEALDELEVYLDNAYAANLSSVKIIHGIGTGALREAIRARLKKMSFVKSANNGDFYDGGSAVTIVEFKR